MTVQLERFVFRSYLVDISWQCTSLLTSGRQYREAGQISQQVKALTQQLEEEQQQKSLLESQLSSHTTQLLSLNQQVANMEAKIISLRKEKGNNTLVWIAGYVVCASYMHASKNCSVKVQPYHDHLYLPWTTGGRSFCCTHLDTSVQELPSIALANIHAAL